MAKKQSGRCLQEAIVSMKLQIHYVLVKQLYQDIYYLKKELHKNKENYGERLFEVYQKSLLGLDEVIKKLWTIIDSSKTGEKEKMKAISLIMQSYKMRFEMIKSEPELINQKRYMKDLNSIDI
jgi:hypothetical protein